MALPGFRDYLLAERSCSNLTIRHYVGNLRWFAANMGDLPLLEITPATVITFKARMSERGAGQARIATVTYALKGLLVYARDVLRMSVPDLSGLKAPRPPRRAVLYLSDDELKTFLEQVPLRTWAGKPRISGYRFRALLETLAATGMRISEAIALNRDSVDMARKEAVIIGKGNKQRTVFFTDRAVQWITRYLDLRADTKPPLFVTADGSRVTTRSVQQMFRRHGKWLGFEKRVTPHIIRHTTATHLLKNGCPIGAIKEILGHSNLETTCRFYLGVLSKDETRALHHRYVPFADGSPPDNLPGAPSPPP